MTKIRTFDGVELAYTIDNHTDSWAQPDSVLCIHGFCENMEAWQAWVPYFSRKYRMIRFDQRGFGASSPITESFAYTTDVFARDLVSVIDQIAQCQVHVIAGKSGAISAIHLAGTRPDLVKTLTLVCSGLWPPKAPGRVEYMEQHGVRAWAHSTMRARVGTAMPQPGVEWWADMMGGTSLTTARAYMRWIGEVDLEADLKRIACPAIVITTKLTDRAQAGTTLHDRIRHSELAVMDVDGYNAYAADPDGCAGVALDFLSRHRGVKGVTC